MLIEQNEIDKAADVIQEVQIETYGSIEKKEKLDYILYQVWVMMIKKDYVRTYIISKKIDPPHLNEKGLEEQKIQYYKLMILYYVHEKAHMNVARAFKAIYDTLKEGSVSEDKMRMKKSAFENYVLFLMLAPYSNEKVDFLNITQKFYKKELEANPVLDEYVRGFLTNEVMPLYSDKLWQQVGGYEPFRKDEMENAELHFKALQRGIIHHNLKVVEMYYIRITMARLAVLNNVTVEVVEDEISELVCNGLLRAKIDRILGVVDFRRQMQPHDFMNDWSGDVKSLLNLVEETCHLINREHVIHTKGQD
eukprot:TRINITY_DN88700_c1_g1_i1.p1 TRINITY_DN88700_c1_g1~~TRINITY_DN88700_c1_g1_i1.p1  ORF type:complete len:307 (-),score=65.16 TRINITY_DN88700_c1_g1_i1:86-1006(-)